MISLLPGRLSGARWSTQLSGLIFVFIRDAVRVIPGKRVIRDGGVPDSGEVFLRRVVPQSAFAGAQKLSGNPSS